MAQVLESPAKPDWPLAQTLYLQGKSPKEIEAITGIPKQSVSVKANQRGWTAALRKSRPITQVSVEIAKDKDEETALTKQSDRTRTALADVIARSAEKLASHPIPTVKVALSVNQDAEAMVRNAAKVFGWSESSTQPLVRIDIMNNALTLSEQANVPRLGEKPVIDVTSEPVPLPPPDC